MQSRILGKIKLSIICPRISTSSNALATSSRGLMLSVVMAASRPWREQKEQKRSPKHCRRDLQQRHPANGGSHERLQGYRSRSFFGLLPPEDRGSRCIPGQYLWCFSIPHCVGYVQAGGNSD